MGTCATSCGPWQPLGTRANTGRHGVLTRMLPCRTRQGGAELGADAGADAAAGAALQAQSECGAASGPEPGAAALRGISCGLASPGRPGSPWDGQGRPLGDVLSGRPGSQQRGSAGVRGRRGAAEERADPRAGRGAAEDPERRDAAAPGRKGRRRRARGGGAPRSRGAVRGCSWPLEAQGWPRTCRRPTKPLRAERDGSARVRVRARSDSAGGAGGSSDPSAQ